MKPILFLCTALLVASHVGAADAPELKATHPKRGEITRFVTLPGNIRANQQATLYAKVTGYLAKVTVDKGQTVKAGEVLAEIEVLELQADLKKYQADARVAAIDLER